MNHFMRIPTSVYWDDYPMLVPDILADQADADVSEFLSIWGGALRSQEKRGSALHANVRCDGDDPGCLYLAPRHCDVG